MNISCCAKSRYIKHFKYKKFVDEAINEQFPTDREARPN